MIVMSNHARARWAQRIGDLDIEEELAYARRPSKRLRRAIDEACRANPHTSDRHYLVSPAGVVFVMSGPVVVTVFAAAEARRRARRLRAMERVIVSGQ